MAETSPPPGEPNAPPERRRWRPWHLLLALTLALVVVQVLLSQLGPKNDLPYSEFKQHLTDDKIERVTISKDRISGTFSERVDGKTQFSTIRVDDPELVAELTDKQVEVRGTVEEAGCGSGLSWLFPFAVMLFVLFWLQRRMTGSPGAMTFGRNKAKLYVEKDVRVTFDDVAGVDEAKEELAEVIEFLRTPDKFRRLGGRLPKGILLVGPPGTGKTLLARAEAGEAGVPFFSISGSEFVEMFVGVGAARVRDLFNDAKQRAPCIVFIDELDALGKARGVGPMAHEEREQTLNQLLVELDGFDPHSGVVLMAATNRPETLDPALLRAGRFDRQILVDRPDKLGRLQILQVHARSVQLDETASLEEVAAMTAGFAGADLANIINEAALLAVRRKKDKVDGDDLREAVERLIAGLEKKNRVLTADEKERVAHHELGHALLAMTLPGTAEVQKISIIPRGIAALGYTLQLPTEDRYLMTRSELETKIAVLLGGRAAEELVYGEVSTGAHDDLRKATDIASAMVNQYGMSDTLGQVSLERDSPSPFLDLPQRARATGHSDDTAREIDCEIRRIVDQQYERAKSTLRQAEPFLRKAAKTLIERETLSGEQLRLMAKEHSTTEDPARAIATVSHSS